MAQLPIQIPLTLTAATAVHAAPLVSRFPGKHSSPFGRIHCNDEIILATYDININKCATIYQMTKQ